MMLGSPKADAHQDQQAAAPVAEPPRVPEGEAKMRRELSEPKLSREELSETRKALTEEVKELAKGDGLPQLRDAVQRARAAKVDRRDLEGAEKALKRLEAEESLRQALQAQDQDLLKKSLAWCKSVGKVNKALIDDAEKQLLRIRTEETLRTAMELQETGMLQMMIDEASYRGISKELVQQAQEMLQSVGRKGLAKKGSAPLAGGAKSSSSDNVAENAASSVVQNEMTKALEDAITLGESGALKMALEPARQAKDPPTELIERAERVLANVEASQALKGALRTKDPKQLKAAVDKAREADSQSELRPRAEALLAQLQAREGLTAAIKSKSEQELVDAVRAAKQANVERMRIEKAEKMLQQVQQVQAAAVSAAS